MFEGAIIEGLFKVGQGLLERFFPDPEKRAAAALELERMKQNGELAALAAKTELAKAQIALDTAETQNGSVLGKWRGGLGWVLAGSLAYQLVIYPFMVAFILIFQPTFPVDKLPKLDWHQLGSVLLGMLGISG